MSSLEKAYDLLSSEFQDLYPSKVEKLENPPDALTFSRCFVSPNKPVVIRNGINDWPAFKHWSPQYFREKIGQLQVTVTVTPNGLADGIYQGHFVQPEERQMVMSDFLDIIERKQDHENRNVFYIQKQNSNLNDEFSCLLKDIKQDIPWGTAAFGTFPDAVNFWMGDERAVTSMHRDHYENLYCVISGTKTFTLLPPTDLPYIPYEEYPSSHFKEKSDGHFELVTSESKVSWIAIDPLNPDLEKYPNYRKAHPLTVTVHAGEILYLPSLWFHHVQQSHACIAVNYWHDMMFDIKWAYYKFLEQLSQGDKEHICDM